MKDYGVIIDDKIFWFRYEEMVELLAAIRDTTQEGNEYFAVTKKRAKAMLDLLPMTNY